MFHSFSDLSLPTYFLADTLETTTGFTLEWIGIDTNYRLDVSLDRVNQTGFNFVYKNSHSDIGKKFRGNVTNLGTPGGTYNLVLTAFDESSTGSDSVTAHTCTYVYVLLLSS